MIFFSNIHQMSICIHGDWLERDLASGAHLDKYDLILAQDG